MQPWFEIAEARSLIQSCAHRRPKMRRDVEVGLVHDYEVLRYIGRRVDRLIEVRAEHLNAALRQADAMTDREAASAFMAEAGIWISIEDAVDAALQARAVCRRAA